MLPRLYRTEADYRKKQINTLMVFNDNVTEIVEGYEYQIKFMAGKNELCLRVRLPNDFPKEKPILNIAPNVIHPWVTAEGEITSAPGLLNFTIHSDLGRVVQAIIREFERNPPPLIAEQVSNQVQTPSIPINNFYKKKFSVTDMTVAPVQSIPFPELNTLSLEELQLLNECVERQDEFIDNLPQMRDLNKNLDDLISQVEELAEKTLSEKDHLQNAKENINKSIEEVTKLTFENERLHNIHQQLSDKYSPKNIKEELRLATEKADNESELIADEFLKGSMSIDSFLNQYIKARTMYQTRKTKEEKLSQQLSSLEKAGF